MSAFINGTSKVLSGVYIRIKAASVPQNYGYNSEVRLPTTRYEAILGYAVVGNVVAGVYNK